MSVSDYFRILWTAVPDGIDLAGRMRLRILVQPRLFDTPPDATTCQAVEDTVAACFNDWPSAAEKLVKGMGSQLTVKFYKTQTDGSCSPLSFQTSPSLDISLPAKIDGSEPDQEWNPGSWRTTAWQKIIFGTYLGRPSHDPWMSCSSSSSAARTGRAARTASSRAHAAGAASGLRSPTFSRSYPAHYIATSLRQVSKNQFARIFSPSIDPASGAVQELEDDLIETRWTSRDRKAAAAAQRALLKELNYLRHSNNTHERVDGPPTTVYDKHLVESYLQVIGQAQRSLNGAAPSSDTLKKQMYEHLGRLQHRDVHRVASHSPRSSLSAGAHQAVELLTNGLYSQHPQLNQRGTSKATPKMAHFLGVAAFHGRSGRPRLPDATPAGLPPPYDFFQKISLLQNYPNILPEFGLVLVAHVNGLTPQALAAALGGSSTVGTIGAVSVGPVVRSSASPGLQLDSLGPVLSIASATGLNLGQAGEDFQVADRHDLYGGARSRDNDPNDPTLRMVHWISHGALDFSAQIDARLGTQPSQAAAQSGSIVEKLKIESLDYDGGALKLINFAHTQQRANGPKVITSAVAPSGAAGQSNFWVVGANDKASALFNWSLPVSPPITLDDHLLDKAGAWGALQRYLTCHLDRSLSTDWRAHRMVEHLDIAIDPHTLDSNGNPNPVITKVSVRVHRAYNQTLNDPLDQQILIWYLDSNDNPAPDQFEQSPSHRSARISLISAARDSEVARSKFNSERLEGNWRSNTKQSPTDPAPVLLDSADLVLGLAPYKLVDKTWVSMSRRKEVFDWDGTHKLEFDQVAPVRLGTSTTTDAPASSSSNAPPNTSDDHAAPRLFKWNGPSLTVPPSAADATMHGTENNEPPPARTSAHLVPVTLSVPEHSEPALRFSEVNADGSAAPLNFQVRIINRAGGPTGRIPNTDSNMPNSNFIGSCSHLRYEPIPAPVVLLNHPFEASASPQKSLNRLVIETSEADIRWLAPPRGDVDLCWTHGMFDVPDEASFDDLGSFDAVKLNDDGNFLSAPIRNPAKGEAPSEKTAKVPRYERGGPGYNSAYPYYPDPMARRLAFRIEDFRGHVISTYLKRRDASLTWYRPDHSWPRARAIRVELKHADAWASAMHAEWDPEEGSLTIWLPPAWRAFVKLTCVPDLDKASQFGLGVMGLFQEHVGDAEAVRDVALSVNAVTKVSVASTDVVELIRAATLAGENPLISPPLELELVRPVEKPLTPPAFSVLTLIQGAGLPLNTAVLSGAVQIDAKSVGLVDYTAEWYDWSDDPDKSDRPMVDPDFAKVHPSLGNALRQNLSIPSKKWLTLEPNADATSISVDSSNGTHSFPDTRHRFVDYVARAHSSFRRYYDPNRDTDEFVEPSASIRLEFRNTVPPSVPSVAYGVPSFGWNVGRNAQDRKQFLSERRGGNVRLWLSRHWLSTGEGELLGVVCLSPNNSVAITDPDSQGRYFSRWGSDPTRPRATLPQTIGPTVDDFLGATNYLGTPARDETGNLVKLTLDLATYSPQYDLSRRLWYCDIQLKTIPSNYAFMKLALVRYQHASIQAPAGAPAVGISGITLADFAQLYPNRAASVTRTGRRQLDVRVYARLSSDSHGEGADTDAGSFYIRVERYSHGHEPHPHPNQLTCTYTTKPPEISAGELAHFIVDFPTEALHRYTVTVFEGDVQTGDQSTMPARIVYADVIELAQTGIL